MMQQDLTRALNAAAQPHFDSAVAALSKAHQRYQTTPLPHMKLAAKTDDIAAIQDLAGQLGDGASRILILGTGGSSLGAQVLAQVHGSLTPAGQISGPHLVFVDNLDGESYARLLDTDLSATGFSSCRNRAARRKP